jgi:hypothetical protein
VRVGLSRPLARHLAATPPANMSLLQMAARRVVVGLPTPALCVAQSVRRANMPSLLQWLPALGWPLPRVGGSAPRSQPARRNFVAAMAAHQAVATPSAQPSWLVCLSAQPDVVRDGCPLRVVSSTPAAVADDGRAPLACSPRQTLTQAGGADLLALTHCFTGGLLTALRSEHSLSIENRDTAGCRR